MEIDKVMCSVKTGEKLNLAQIHRIESRPVHGHLLQFDWLFYQGLLHKIYKQNGSNYHQLILPFEFRAQAMDMLHDQQDHQAVGDMLSCVQGGIYVYMLYQDVKHWVKHCALFQAGKGP